MNRLLFLCFIVLFSFQEMQGQHVNNFRSRYVSLGSDATRLDTLSIVPGSMIVEYKGIARDSNFFKFDLSTGILIWLDSTRNMSDSARINYRVFPVDFTKTQQFRDRTLLGRETKENEIVPYLESSAARDASLFELEGLNRSGSISRGVTVGSNQDAVVSSSLNLQLEGKIGNDISILAAITDDNIPIQAEGNTQQLQEFDRVFIQLSNNEHKLIAGDFVTQNPDGYFLRYLKKSQGGLYNLKTAIKNNGRPVGIITAAAGAAVSKGKFARQLFNGVEGNQGPYRLTGAEGETFIVVLSGSERVFIDGQLLQRGQDRDYIIDYNTAELSFTTRRLMTKDLRITVEFQYSDKNYARTMLLASTDFQSEKLRAYIHYYSEQDSKNQPLQQDLSDDDKEVLSDAGDDFSKAVVERADSVAFNINEVLYAKRDTIVNAVSYSVYVYSINSDSAYYRLSFSNVGANRGNYILLEGVTNGKAYQWVAPLNGIPQGLYEPVVQLVTPKKRRMVVLGTEYRFTQKAAVGVEFAGSKNDQNLFSTIDDSDNAAGAVRIKAGWKSDSIPGGWRLQTDLMSEIAGRNFVPVENYRAVEFIRDWNLTGVQPKNDEVLNYFTAVARKGTKGEIRAGLRNFLRGNDYTGWMQMLGTQWNLKHVLLKADASYLLTDALTQKSNFLRHKEEVRYIKGSWNPGLRYEQERNELKDSTGMLSITAFNFRIAEAFLQRADTVKVPVNFSVIRRLDSGIKGANFTAATEADMISAGTGYRTAKSRISILTNYRNLKVTDTLYATVNPEETITARLEGNTVFVNGGVNLSGYYEAGTGREAKRNYSYIEVSQGTGSYAWIDYNADGIPQLNEFEVAAFSDQANYIRILTPTDEYIKVYFNQFNAVLNLNPAAWMKNQNSFAGKFALQSAVRYDNRLTGASLQEGWNPLPGTVSDSQLISTQAGTRHTLFFNRSSTSFASDVTWQLQQSRNLLANGIEDRRSRILTWNGRSNVNKWLNIQLQLEAGNKRSTAQAFEGRNYNIERVKAEPRFNIQPGATYRLSFTYRHEEKDNILGEGVHERARVRDAGMEWRYSSIRQGLITARFNYLFIDYNADPNTSIAYEMLEALKVGANITWGLSLQRNLGTTLQLSLNYEGRKPSGLNVVHTGSAEVRAFF